ncbi:chorismate-binding protein [Prochlorococcus sp. AH-736-B08]|nr:chorismate-binding protein [Prochlorococcus sp. AH-736-B08]
MVKFSSREIEGYNNLIKMLLAEPEKYKEAINAIKKDIAYMPIEIKKSLIKRILHYEQNPYYIVNNR